MNSRLEKVQSATSGSWNIERFTVDQRASDFDALRAIISSNGFGRHTPPGTYIALKRRGEIIMSNTPDELRDLHPLRWHAEGHVLIAGLGLGCAVDVALACPRVTAVTVVEKAEDVIALVAPSFAEQDRVSIIHDDIFTWAPPNGQKYGAAWFDIWDAICIDNLPEMKTLHRKFGRLAAWKGSWCRHLCEGR